MRSSIKIQIQIYIYIIYVYTLRHLSRGKGVRVEGKPDM